MTHCNDPQIMTARDGFGDALPFINAGIPTIFVVGWPHEFISVVHLEESPPDKVSANALKAVTDSVAILIKRLAIQEA